MVTIKPSGSWVVLDLHTLWAYRELFYFLTWRNVKVRYKQTLLGIIWAVVQVLLPTLIFTLFIGRLANIPSDNIAYPLFAYSGLLLWLFFANAATNSTISMLDDSKLITKVYFPRLAIPGAAVGAALVDLAIASVFLVGLMIYYDIEVTRGIVMLPVLVILTTLLALGVGTWLSALNVKYQDVRYALPFLIQMSMFASPVIYPASLVPERWQWLYAVNPLTGIVEGFRAALFGLQFNWLALSVSAVVTLGLLVYSAYSFRRLEKNMADFI